VNQSEKDYFEAGAVKKKKISKCKYNNRSLFFKLLDNCLCLNAPQRQHRQSEPRIFLLRY